MGVPAFFKWLTLRYPKVVMDAIEEINSDFDINSFLKNKYNSHTAMPNIDNLYLDMNGIIHPCCHPQDRVINIIKLKIIHRLNRKANKRCLIVYSTILTNL